MLLNLHVKNVVLIDEIDVDFTGGLMVFTGETGAGKSLILGSVNLALGAKASKEIIRKGADYALVELTFTVPDDCAGFLQENDINTEDGNVVTVTRKITAQRSVVKINSETVSVSLLKQVMERLVDVYGQHEHQSLLYKKNHVGILDKFAGSSAEKLLCEISTEYKKYMELKKELELRDTDDKSRASKIDFLNYEIKEIELASLKEGEDEELEDEYRKLSSVEDTEKILSEIYSALEGAPGGLTYVLSDASSSLNSVRYSDKRIENLKKMVSDIDFMCSELIHEINSYEEELESDPQRINEVSERLDLINRLKLKYGRTISAVLDAKKDKEQELNSLINYEKWKVETEKKIKKSSDYILEKSAELGNIRREAGIKLENLVTAAMMDLNFDNAVFQVDIKKREGIFESGNDDVEFLISTNVGEDVRPLTKVASGGELSRIMLAIKSVAADKSDIGTMIFDEIDTGIGGVTALKVAEKLAVISRNCQVICISHLPQIAAMADTHYLIEKRSGKESTRTDIFRLDHKGSVMELSRMGGSTDQSDAAQKNSEEMIEHAKKFKLGIN